MKRHTQVILYHLLPIAFWLLAIGGSLVPVLLNLLPFNFHFSPFTSHLSLFNYLYGFAVAAVVLVCIAILKHIKRHTSAVVPCWHVAVLLGIASYWLPTVVFLIVPMWIYLASRRLFEMRAFMASFLGFLFVAVWAVVGVFMEWIACPWMDFFAKENALGWIPLGAVLIAWLASTIARENLRVR